MEKSIEEYMPGNLQAFGGKDRIMRTKKLLIKINKFFEKCLFHMGNIMILFK